MSQLERDLSKRIRSRLGLWAQDSIKLYEMADLEDEAHAAMMSTLMSFNAFLLTQMKVDPKHAGKVLADAMTEMAKLERCERQ